MSKQTLIFRRGVSAIALASAAVGLAPAAWAQDETAVSESAASDDAAYQEIIVTGSRLGRSGFDSPTPVNVIDEDRMKNLGIPAVADVLNQLPSFRPSTSPQSNLFRISGAIAANSVDLRGLGTTRTLTLIDGRRFVPTADNGTVDLNGVPSGLVKRVEVVTGGASAAYGADAVAGVVNLILDTDFTGLKLDINGGISGHGDGENYTVSLAGGTEFAGGRGHIVAGVEYQKNYGVGACEERAYCREYVNYINNPGFIGGKSTNGLPAVLVLNNVIFAENPTGILVGAIQTVNGVNTTLGQQLNSAAQLPDALKGLQFNQAGSGLVPYQFGNYLSGVLMQGGDPSSADRLYGFGDVPLLTPSSHVSAFAHAEYDLTDSVRASAEFLYSHVEGGPTNSSTLVQAPVGGSVGVKINNPFITPEVRAQILAANPNITSILVNAAKVETGPNQIAESKNEIWRAMIGLEGDFGANWSWDASYVRGETSGTLDIYGARLRGIDAEAVDAITPPQGYTGTIYTTPAGAPVICASSVNNPANGCIPVNYFGANSITPQMYDKYFADARQTRKITQDAASVNLRGSLGELWAGPLQVAIGAEWRRDTAEGESDALSKAKAFSAVTATDLPRFASSVIEGYAEASLPLLADAPIAKSLTVDGAVRFADYKRFGSATAWKAGVVYEPVDGVMIRLTRSRDVRAPNAAESNPNTTLSFLPFSDPFAGGTHTITNVTGGNPNLDLERADTETAGIVFQPAFLPGFRLSVDYYDINVKGAIDTLSAAAIVAACAQKDQLCDLIDFVGTPKQSEITQVYSNFQNLSNLNAEGFELVAQYNIPGVAGGEIDLSVNANYVLNLETTGATGVVTRLHGTTGNAGSLANVQGVPTYKIGALATYSRDNWSITAHGRYIPRAILDVTKIGPEDDGYDINLPNSATTNRVSSRFYLDLMASVNTGIRVLGGTGLEVYGGINNVFDTYPPGQLRFFGNPLHYDVVGRSFRLGVRTSI